MNDPTCFLLQPGQEPKLTTVSQLKAGDCVQFRQADGTCAPPMWVVEDPKMVLGDKGEMLWGLKATRKDPSTPFPPNPGIMGQRELTQGEVDLMNRIKTMGEQVRGLVEELHAMGDKIEPRFLAIGTTYVQLGLQQLVRAVARPTSFC